MSRYIDADHLRKWILSWWERTEPTSEYLKGGDILNQIDREPSIDVMDVVTAYQQGWCDALDASISALNDAKFQLGKEAERKQADTPQTDMPEYAEWKDAYKAITDCGWK